MTPPPSEPTTGTQVMRAWRYRNGTYAELAAEIDAALQEVQLERDEAIRAVFGFVHSEHCPLTHGPTGAKVQCLSCQLEAAEQREREAGEREKVLREALKSLMNDDGSSASLPAYDTRCVLALAAIRSGPAPRPHVCTYECANTDCEHVVGPAPVSDPPTAKVIHTAKVDRYCPCENPYCPELHSDGRMAKVMAPPTAKGETPPPHSVALDIEKVDAIVAFVKGQLGRTLERWEVKRIFDIAFPIPED